MQQHDLGFTECNISKDDVAKEEPQNRCHPGVTSKTWLLSIQLSVVKICSLCETTKASPCPEELVMSLRDRHWNIAKWVETIQCVALALEEKQLISLWHTGINPAAIFFKCGSEGVLHDLEQILALIKSHRIVPRTVCSESLRFLCNVQGGKTYWGLSWKLLLMRSNNLHLDAVFQMN